MRLFRITLLLTCVAFLSACIAEDFSRCGRNVVLKFEYVYNYEDVFGEQVQSVDLFVYNSNGLLVHRETINSGQLDTFAGTNLGHLSPGTYRIVAWGNALSQTDFAGVNPGDHIDNAVIGRQGVPRSTTPLSGHGDRLHFAPCVAQNEFFITVPTMGDVTATLPFARSYIAIEVFVRYFESYTGETAAPIIEITGAASHFCFNRIPEGDITLRETSVVLTQYIERPWKAAFRTKLFDDSIDFAKELHVRSGMAGNAILFTLDDVALRNLIAQYMLNNGIASLKNDRTPQRVIPIVITFGEYNVRASVEVVEFERVPSTGYW